jgi:hypothetical protein
MHHTDKLFVERVKRQYKNVSWDKIDKVDLLSTKQKTQFRNEIIEKILRQSKVILIDLPDYPKKDLRLLNRDIGGLQTLWMETLRLGTAASSSSFRKNFSASTCSTIK